MTKLTEPQIYAIAATGLFFLFGGTKMLINKLSNNKKDTSLIKSKNSFVKEYRENQININNDPNNRYNDNEASGAHRKKKTRKKRKLN